ncbi:MAG TPA: CBS domain-containing protein [Gemmatales bacterium]|nr:CBS domain-containing protein [Gemmatales bacterium]
MPATLLGQPLVLSSGTVDMAMSDNPVSVSDIETAQGVAQVLIEHRISAVPIINEAGHPVGVISRTDLVNHLVQLQSHVRTLEEDWFECGNIVDEEIIRSQPCRAGSWSKITAKAIMNTRLFTVTPEDSLEIAVELILKHHVHRLFVVDHDGVLVGIISTFDILNRLERRFE